MRASPHPHTTGLLRLSTRHDVPLGRLLAPGGDVVGVMLAVMERPLQALVLCAQVAARMWVRNGYALLNDVANYTFPDFRRNVRGVM